MSNYFVLAAQLLIVTVAMTSVNGQNHSAFVSSVGGLNESDSFMSSDGSAQNGSLEAGFPTRGGLNITNPFMPTSSSIQNGSIAAGLPTGGYPDYSNPGTMMNVTGTN